MCKHKRSCLHCVSKVFMQMCLPGNPNLTCMKFGTTGSGMSRSVQSRHFKAGPSRTRIVHNRARVQRRRHARPMDRVIKPARLALATALQIQPNHLDQVPKAELKQTSPSFSKPNMEFAFFVPAE